MATRPSSVGLSPAARTVSIAVCYCIFAALQGAIGYADDTRPVISSVSVSGVTASAATITWITNEPSTSRVQYGLTTSYGSLTPVDPTLVTSHTVTVTGLASNRRYYFRVHSADASGNLSRSPRYSFTTKASDTTAPAVTLTTPAGGATVSGTIAVTAAASDNVGVTGVQFKLDGANLGAEDTTSPYSVSWNTAGVANGAHTLTATARDGAGNTSTSAVGVSVSNAVVPTVTLRPQDTSLNLNATNYSAATMLFTYTWPAQQVANAIVMKFDLSGLPAGAVVQDATLSLALVESDPSADATYAMSAHRIVNRNPVIATATGYTIDGLTGWTANACCSNNVPMAQADISSAYDTRAIDKTPGFKSWTLTAMVQEWLNDPAANFGVLLNSDPTKAADRYRYFASMEHADPALRPYLRFSYAAQADTTPPVVVMSSPAPGAGVSGTVSVSASASDNVGVGSVQFQLDGANLGTADTTAPYSIAWNTTTVVPGAHTLRAIARDAAGNTTTSAAIGVAVLDVTLPSVSITAPLAGASVSGSVTATATATDSVGVTGVQFKLDGVNLGAQDTTPPYTISWDTTSVADGSHTLTAVAWDAAGNQRTSAGIQVTVANTAPPPPTEWTNEPAGFTVIEETGWESGTLGNWYRIFTSADKPIGVSTISDSLLGESRALQLDYVQGHEGGGGTELRYDIASASRSNEIYVGYYVQVNPQWQGHNSAINKMLYLHDGGTGFAAMWYEMFGSDSAPLGLYVVNQSGSSPSGIHENITPVTFTRGQWHKVEIYQKQGDANNGIVRVWVNGVLAIDRSDVDTRSTPIDNVTISGIWGGVGDYKNQADYMRFDCIRISRPGSGTVPPPPSSGTTLIQEDFEDANLAARGWYDSPTPLLSTVEHIAGSVRSIEYRFNAGATTPTAAVALRRKFTPTDSVYLSYYVKYSTNWVGSLRPYHPHEFHFLTSADGDWSGLAFTHLTAYVEQNGGTPLLGIQDGANVDQSRVGQDLTASTEQRGVAGCNGSSDGYPDNCYLGGSGYVNEKKWRAATPYFTDTAGPYYKSDWHLVEAYLKLNTVSGGKGLNDGIVQYWFDGQPVIDRRNVLLRTGANATMTFNQVVIAPYIGDGSPVTQSFWIDNLRVRTARP